MYHKKINNKLCCGESGKMIYLSPEKIVDCKHELCLTDESYVYCYHCGEEFAIKDFVRQECRKSMEKVFKTLYKYQSDKSGELMIDGKKMWRLRKRFLGEKMLEV